MLVKDIILDRITNLAMVKMYYVRHGQAHHNQLFNKIGAAAYKDPSVTDSGLTVMGMQQAEELRERYSGIEAVSLVLVSPLIRCLQTMETMIQGGSHRPRVVALDHLIEWEASDTPNHRKNVRELEQRFPSVDFSNVQSVRDAPRTDTITDLEKRVESFRSFVALLDKNEKVIVVGHTSWLNQLLFGDVTRKDLKHAHIYEARDDGLFDITDSHPLSGEASDGRAP